MHQVFVRYMTRHKVMVNNRKWERSEDERLKRLVAHSRINDFIPWGKVAYYMDRRTKDQCYQRYVYSLKVCSIHYTSQDYNQLSCIS